MLRLFRVEGISMVPSLLPNDILLTRKREIQINDLIIFRSSLGLLVKRVKQIESNFLTVVGDNLNVRDLTQTIIIHPNQYEATVVSNLSSFQRTVKHRFRLRPRADVG